MQWQFILYWIIQFVQTTINQSYFSFSQVISNNKFLKFINIVLTSWFLLVTILIFQVQYMFIIDRQEMITYLSFHLLLSLNWMLTLPLIIKLDLLSPSNSFNFEHLSYKTYLFVLWDAHILKEVLNILKPIQDIFHVYYAIKRSDIHFQFVLINSIIYKVGIVRRLYIVY